ncbi:helix-turn-helix domain-containing protein [Kineococcus sp. NBC_00420]|uniref:helix-turn-helix domain-containing protein n=1 Tax=Kineococcus sp. NBC_00420 TaxID=2903564 RepID=UPI002E1F9AFC
MPNDRLKQALNAHGMSPQQLGEQLGVDPKTVSRWISQGRPPYPKYRAQVAALLREAEDWLWPEAVSEQRRDAVSASEVVEVFPRRAAVPWDTWPRLFSEAAAHIDVLVYAGLFLPEQMPAVLDTFVAKAQEGVRIRLLLGDPKSPAVALRGEEEGIGRSAVAVKVRNALDLLRPKLKGVPGVHVRLHAVTLYTSIYRADDQMLANPHVYGLPAAQAPAMHLRKLTPGGLFDTYTVMYDKVWDDARPAWS